MVTDWNIGTLWKTGIWLYYILSNFLGSIGCALLIMSVWLDKKRRPSDLMQASVAGACMCMSLTCGTQCLISLIHGSFYGADPACRIEAIAHVTTIMVEFVSVAWMTYLFADQVRFNLIRVFALFKLSYSSHRETLSNRLTLQMIAIIWISCLALVIALSFISKIYLMSAGTYCFFSFTSPAIFTLCSILVASLGLMVYYHVKVLRHYQFLINNTTQSIHPIHLAQNLNGDPLCILSCCWLVGDLR